MNESIAEPTDATVEALSWFGYEPGPEEWVNGTWIGVRDHIELRIVDIVTGPGRHTLLVRMDPDVEPSLRWDNLDYAEFQSLLDEAKALAARHGIALWDFAGAATAVPTGHEGPPAD